jgi:hypothetical protein
MKFRVLLGAVALGLALFGVTAAHAGTGTEAAVAGAGSVHAGEILTALDETPENDAKGEVDWLAGGDAEPETEEVCTVLMVWRGSTQLRVPALARRHTLAFTSVSPPVPPPESGVLIFKTFAASAPPGLGTLESASFQASIASSDSSAAVQRTGCHSSSKHTAPRTTTSAWDLDDDPSGLSLDPSDHGEPDSEVCTVLMVWRGQKPAIVEAARLNTLAPFPSILPPVPPPQPGATHTDRTFECAACTGRAATRDSRRLDSHVAHHPAITSFSSFDSLRQIFLPRRAAARVVFSAHQQIATTDKIPPKGSTLRGTS